MKNTFILNGLDCANCAAKIENAIQKIEGVHNVSVNFMSRKMVIECDEENLEDIIIKSKKIIKKEEPDVKVEKM